MRIALLSDIHANDLALLAVLEDSNKKGVDQHWFLGDIVGYGPNPVVPMQWLLGQLDGYPAPTAWVMGNHDAMITDLILQGKTGVVSDPHHGFHMMTEDLVLPDDLMAMPQMFKPCEFEIHKKDSKGNTNGHILYRGKCQGIFSPWFSWDELNGISPLIALELNRLELAKSEEVDLLWRNAFDVEKVLPVEMDVDGTGFVLVHADHDNPITRYVYPWQKDIHLPATLKSLWEKANVKGTSMVQTFGHTHVPTLVRAMYDDKEEHFVMEDEFIFPDKPYAYLMNENGHSLAIINPGSVGQPRDLDQRASYAVLDTEQKTITFHRVAYDYRRVFRELSLKSYPSTLRDRLLSARPTRETPAIWVEQYQKAALEDPLATTF